MKKIKFLLAIVLCFTMLISSFPTFVFASATNTVETTIVGSGTCGDNAIWKLDDSGTLTISGYGDMFTWTFDSRAPWYSYRKSIKNIIISDKITSIGACAFYGCTNLTQITIPDSVTFIGNHSFVDCINLETIGMSNSITSIQEYAFYNCRKLTAIVIPQTVVSIGEWAFADCRSLLSIDMPYGVKEIGGYVFYNCYSLTSIGIPSSVISIGEYAISECTSLVSIDVPYSVTEIHGTAFDGSSTCIENINVDQDNTGYYSSGNCLINKSTQELIIGCKNSIIPEGVISIGEYAFANCTNLLAIKIPESVISIGEEAFRACEEIEDIIIPNSVKTIGPYAFSHCYNLKSVCLPKSIETLDGTFFSCSRLEEIVIPSSVTSIGSSTFQGCDSLTNIGMPNSVTYIGSYAFGSCDSLKNIYYSGTEEEWAEVKIESGNDGISRAQIHFNSTLEGNPITADLKYGSDQLNFGVDMTGFVGGVINSLVVYTSANENIASLDITSSNTNIVEIGTIEIGGGDYITSENEHMATISLKLKAEGTSTITITSPEGISTSVLVVVYPKEVESEETNQYIQEHTFFVNSNKYSNLTTNASFYNTIWKHEENSSNFTRYAAWDVIGRVGKFAALDFYGAFETENPYDVVLVDTFRSYVNNEKSKAAEVFETTTKNILGSPGVFNDVLDVLKTSESWNSDLTQDWLQFTDNVQEDWIQGVFFTESTFDLDDYNPELYKVLKEVFSKTDKSGFEKVFKNIKNFGTITDYITSGGDVVFRFFDAYQKYRIAEALFETNEYMLASVEMIAEFQMTGENSELLLDALEPYWDACDYDSAFSSVCSIMLEDGLLGSTGNVAYTLLGKELLRDFVYAAIHKVTGLSLGALVATYNLTYICLDYLSGFGDLTETHKLMNAAALLEKEYIELAKDKAETLVAEKTHQAAAEFDTVWGFLQSLEGYCYKTMSAYVSAFKREYTTNYIIETAITKNPFFAVIDGIKLSEDLTSCDSAIQAVVYLESEWVNANCHKGIYSSSNLMTVKCPTDVYVYDSENNLVLSIIDNEVTFCADHITAFVDGDEKIFVLPTDQEYDVQITATGNGTMDYAVKSFGEIELLRTIRYDDVELVDGTSYAADVPSELYVEKENYNLKTEAGAQIEADYDSLAPENETLADISGTITCCGNDNDSVTIRLLQDANEIESVQITDNSYVFESVVSGTHTLEVSKANHVTRTYEITVSDEDVVQNVKIHLLGDVNGDGRVNTIDVNRVYAHVRETNPLTGYELKCANVAGSGDTVNTIDVNRIYAHVKETNLLW